jgi:hypothetical protein
VSGPDPRGVSRCAERRAPGTQRATVHPCPGRDREGFPGAEQRAGNGLMPLGTIRNHAGFPGTGSHGQGVSAGPGPQASGPEARAEWAG